MTDYDTTPEVPIPSASASEPSTSDDDPVMLVGSSIPLGEAEALVDSAGDHAMPVVTMADDDQDRPAPSPPPPQIPPGESEPLEKGNDPPGERR